MSTIEQKLRELEERLAKIEALNGIKPDKTLCPKCKIGHLRKIDASQNIGSLINGKLKCSHCETMFDQ